MKKSIKSIILYITLCILLVFIGIGLYFNGYKTGYYNGLGNQELNGSYGIRSENENIHIPIYLSIDEANKIVYLKNNYEPDKLFKNTIKTSFKQIDKSFIIFKLKDGTIVYAHLKRDGLNLIFIDENKSMFFFKKSDQIAVFSE